jgi:transposase/IS1 family transposase
MVPHWFTKCKDFFEETVSLIRGSQKRVTLAKLSKQLGKGGQVLVARTFKVSRNTIRKGVREWETGVAIADQFHERGRLRAEEKLPDLLADIQSIIDGQSQTDPSFKTEKLYTRLTVKEIRKQLIREKRYTAEELPTHQTINTKVNQLGYTLKKVKKAKPFKKIEQTDAIFNKLKETHEEAKEQSNVVRISIDTKDRVKIGDFSRGGLSRIEVKADDHDFSKVFVTPFGILDVTADQVALSFTKSKVTADFMVDAIEQYWITSGYEESKDTLIINSDNGPENGSRRTQFIKRLVEFAARYEVKVILAYYPPYHSKYNPIERVWGRLEQHWNGDLLHDEETVYAFARTMTWKGKHPWVSIVDQIYEKGKKLSKKAMEAYESRIERDSEIGKWFVTLHPDKCKEILVMETPT